MSFIGLFSFVFFICSLNLTIDCFNNQNKTPIVSFQIVNPRNTSKSFKEVKENQFHITKTPNIVVECLARFPMKIVFSGIMPNEIQYTDMTWDRTTELFRVSISFQNIPQATGPYSCVNTDEVAKNVTFKSTIYIFADDGTPDLFLLHWKTSKADSGIRPTSIKSGEMVVVPCLTFRPNIRPSFHYYSKQSISKLQIVPKAWYHYDASEGFIVNITKINFSMLECSFPPSSSIKFQAPPEMSCKTNLGEVKMENDVIYWSSGKPISVECEGIYPMEIAIAGRKKNSHKFSSERSSDKRDNKYYKYFARLDFDKKNIKESYNVSIVCKQLVSKINQKWSVIFEEPAVRKTPPKKIHFHSGKKLFYCSDTSDDMTPTMTVINCHNLANCESARRFDPWTSQLQEKYPYAFNNSNLLADRYLKQDLKIEQNECAILNQDPAIKLGIVYCLLVNNKNSEAENSIVTLQYFIDLNDQIVQEMNIKDITSVLRMPLLSDKKDVYLRQSVNFTCEASNFIFAKGLQFDIIFRNGSRSQLMNPYPRQATEDHDRYKITLNETIYIWSNDITEVECLALKWNNKEWMKVSRKIQVQESKDPEIFIDDYNIDNNLTVINIEFLHKDNKNITCKATGIPQPTLQWVKLDVNSPTSKTVVTTTKTTVTENFVTSTLVFVNVFTLQDKYGMYACIAKNAVGETNRTFYITVNFTGNEHIENGKIADNHQLFFYSVVGAIGLVVLILLVVVCILCRTLKSKQNEIEKLSEVEIQHFLNGNEDLVDKYQELHEVAQYLPYKQQFEIHPSKIEIKNDVLGTGNYGMVLKGTFERSGKTFTVAVKTVKSGIDIRHLRALLSEIKIMMYIGKHPYIIEMIGAITKNIRDGKLYVVVEFCSNGNLQSYLRACRPIFVDQITDDEIKITERTRIKKSPGRFLGLEDAITNVITKRRSRNSNMIPLIQTTNLIKWCYQIASGMEYLANKKVIHGDLATRNLLITENLTVKITDFGLSRYLYEYSNYVTKEKSEAVPWRWLSIEAIQDSKFSTQSDVWAYGITLWEIFSLGETPYQGFCWGEEFVQDLCKGYRMGKPQYATNDIHNTMLECWNKAAVDRPSFEDISNNFKELLERVGTRVDDATSVKDECVSPARPIPEIFISEV